MEKKKLSVAEILAAARKADGGAAGAPKPADEGPAAETPAPTASEEPSAGSGGAAADSTGASTEPPTTLAKHAPSAPAAKAAAGGKRPSTAEILAMARAKAGAEKSAAPAPAKPARQVAPASESPKASPKPPSAAAVAGGPKDTASILAAAHKPVKPGPISKAEAAALAKPVPAAPVKEKKVVPPLPSKPEAAKPKAAKAPVDEERRGILSLMVGSFLGLGFTSLSVTSVLWTLGTARFMFPNVLTEPPTRFKVGFPADFSPGTVETKFVAQYGVWVVNSEYSGQREIFALRTVCTHLGCTPNWLEAEQKFKCPCHGSGFYIDGINFEGPAPRPLERYAIRLADDGQLEIDKSKLFQEELGQWTDPASFVPV